MKAKLEPQHPARRGGAAGDCPRFGPWQVAAALVLFAGCAAAMPGGPGDGGSSTGGPLAAGLQIAGDLQEGLGIFDPSVVYPPGADAGFLAYSVVAPDQLHVHTRLATSTDLGATWTFVAEVNQPSAITVDTTDATVCGVSTCAGAIIHEVASVLVDPDDTPERRFKVFTHSYFAAPGDGGFNLQGAIGHLSLYTASAPAGPWTETAALGWNGPSSFSSRGVAQNLSSDPGLAGMSHCLALTEPGALLWSAAGVTALDLAVGCVFPASGQLQIEIDLVRSLDHGRSFAFVSTLLSAADATALGATSPQINAPDLVQIAGQTYLFATPGGTTSFPGGGSGTGYRSCLALPFASLDAGQLARTNGVPTVARAYLGGPTQFVGACTEAEGAPALGVAGDVLSLSAPFFGIFTAQPTP